MTAPFSPGLNVVGGEPFWVSRDSGIYPLHRMSDVHLKRVIRYNERYLHAKFYDFESQVYRRMAGDRRLRDAEKGYDWWAEQWVERVDSTVFTLEFLYREMAERRRYGIKVLQSTQAPPRDWTKYREPRAGEWW